MHRQIKIVAILMMVEGGLEVLMGIFLVAMGPVMMSLMRSAPPTATGPGPTPPAELFGGLYIGMGVVALVAALLKIIAGIRNVGVRGRVLGFVGLGSCLLSMASCYCIPTALGLGIYGLIVYVNEKSAQAFAMVEGGMPADQALAQLDGFGPPGYPPQYPPPQCPQVPPQYPPR